MNTNHERIEVQTRALALYELQAMKQGASITFANGDRAMVVHLQSKNAPIGGWFVVEPGYGDVSGPWKSAIGVSFILAHRLDLELGLDIPG